MEEIEKKNILIQMITEVNNISIKYGFTFFLAYGTLLGAIRHEGFIPWDTDIDIVVPIQHYNQFCETLSRNLSDKYHVVSNISDNKYTALFSRVCLREVNHVSLHIDIFPIVGASRNRSLQILIKKFVYLNMMMFYMKRVKISERFSNQLIKSIIGLVCKFILLPFPSSLFIKLNDYFSKQFDYDSSDYVYNVCGSYGRKEIIPKVWLGNPIFKKFETSQFPVPEYWHEYLEHFYTDYMTPRQKNYI